MDYQQIKCHQCGQGQLNKIKQCPQRASQACPYIASAFDVPPSFIGRTWLDYLNTLITIALIHGVLWLFNIVITGGRIFGIGLLALIAMEIRLLIWSTIILFVYLGVSKTSTKKIQLPTSLKLLQKQLIHYYRPTAREGFVAYERLGISLVYGKTAVFPIALAPDEAKFGNYSYPPSFLAAAKLVDIGDFSQRIIAQHNLIPQIVRWTLLGLVAQNLVQLNHIKLTRRDLKNNKRNNTLIFVTPKSKLIAHQANGKLEKEFVTQLRKKIKKSQSPAHWESMSVYELLYNLYEKAIINPEERILKGIIEDAIAQGWAKPTPTKGFKAKMKSIYVIPWRLAREHQASVMAEQTSLAEWDQAVRSERKRFVADIETAVLKAMESRRRKRTN